MRDTETVASIVAGDPDGLATAYDRYADPLFTYCRSLLGDTAEAADAVQDTFIIAAARLDALDDPQRLRAWLFAVARGECLRVRRSKTRTPPPSEAPLTGGAGDAGDAGQADSTDGADAAAGEGEEAGRARLRTLFEHASAGLGPGDREVVELQLRQGLKPGEVATVLGVSRGSAHAVASRAKDQLETCLGVLLVGRAGREECAELGSLLTGWDGRLTATLSKRVGRHIAHCSACSARRAVELRPSALLELTPAAALAAGAAESFRRSPRAPAALKAHTIALATEHGPASAAHATAVLSRAGTFGKQGFPKAAHGVLGLGAAGARHGVRSSSRRQAAIAAAVVVAAGVAAAGFALSGGQEHPVADPKTPVSSADLPAVTTSAAATRPTSPAASPSRRSHPRATTPTAVTVTQAAVTTPASAPTTAPPTAASSPSAAPAGTLRVFPGGGSLFLVPGGHGALLFLSASGGTVNWSVSVSGDPDGTITVSPATSGTLTAAHPRVTLEISASRDLSCGDGENPCPTITIEPGGTVLTVTTSGRRHPFKRPRRPDGQDDTAAAATPR
jgi:RNA polymerase sigma factor (sigma-70 family)